ncbi:MAG: acyl carrier protein [Hyphomicrobiales bacterium]
MRPREAAVLDRLRGLLVDALAVDPEAVVPEAKIMDDLDAESIDLMDLRFRIEKEFGIRITADQLTAAFRGVESAQEFRARFTVAALRDYVEGRLEELDET